MIKFFSRKMSKVGEDDKLRRIIHWKMEAVGRIRIMWAMNKKFLRFRKL